MPIAARLLVALLIGIFPAYYVYLEDGDELEIQMTGAKEKLEVVEAKFEKERAKRNKLPELEAKLTFTEQQLKESSKRLPDSFFMNDVLQEASTIARDVGVDLLVFDPGTPEPAGDAFKYMEMPIELTITGKYNQIANFYDRLANLEKMVHVRNMRLVPYQAENRTRNVPGGNQQNADLSASQKSSRVEYRIQASAGMVIYRAMTLAEESQIRIAPVPAKPGAKPAAPAKPDGSPADAPAENSKKREENDNAQLILPLVPGYLAVGPIRLDEKM
jgi:type IV pilus assembly protein PilO